MPLAFGHALGRSFSVLRLYELWEVNAQAVQRCLTQFYVRVLMPTEADSARPFSCLGSAQVSKSHRHTGWAVQKGITQT